MDIGKALLKASEERAGETGRLVSGEGRTEAHVFYRALGYDRNKMQLHFKKCSINYPPSKLGG